MISFNSLTKAQYDALSAITTDRIYFLTDTGELKLNGVDYGAGGAGGNNPAYVELENKTASTPATFEVNFSGKQIQKYPFEDAASGSISFSLKNSGASGDGYAPTVEIQIPLSGEVSTITLPEGAQVVDMPASLPGELSQSRIAGGVKMGITYHDLVFRNEKDFGGNWQTYISHGYTWKEYSQEPKEFNDFWIEVREDDSTISCDNFDASYKLSSSFDKITWTPLTGSTIATGVSAGTKIYFIGNTTTLGSSWTYGWRPYSDKKYAIGGKILSLYNEFVEPVTLTNDNDLYKWQNGKSLLEECSVDFGPVKNAQAMFSSCSNLSALPNGFSVPNATDTRSMFTGCKSLSALPDGFSVPNSTNTGSMFNFCSNLFALPDGFSVPNSTNTHEMFQYCANLSALPDGFSCQNATDTSYMFQECPSLSAWPDGFSCPNATNTRRMFYHCPRLTTLPDSFSVPNATDTSEMFSSCEYITDLPDSFSCSNATNTDSMFSSCERLSGLPDGFSVPNATNTGGMFTGCKSLSALPDGFSAPNATNTGGMFYNCSSLSALPDGFSCLNTTNTNGMFYDCSSLSRLPDGFSCPNATNTTEMFCGCSNLSALPDGFSCQNSTRARNMFNSCSNLSALPEGFIAPNASNSTDIYGMFSWCSNLSTLSDGFSCPNATDAGSMFHGCSNLSALPDGFSVPNATDTAYMFYNCSSLTTIGSNVKIANGTNANANDDTNMDKSKITTIGANFEFFTNATFDGTWDPALGIRNVFPNATSVGSGWRVYNHYDGE